MPAVLRSPRLRRVIVAYTINRTGTWFGVIALSLAVFDHTHSGLAVAALLICSQALPAFIVPAVVARVEASKQRSELSALYAIEAIATAALAVLLWNFWLPGILVLVAVDGTAALAASALLRTEAARVARAELEAPDEHEAEQKANAALNLAFSATFVAGPALAGLVVAAAGASTALFIDVGSFVICALLLLDLNPHVVQEENESVRTRLLSAWVHIRTVPPLRDLLIAQSIGLVFFEAAAPIEVAYAKRTLHAGAHGYGFLVSAWGVGVVLGSILFARAGSRRLGLMVTAGTLAIGAAYLGFSVAPTLAVASFAAAVGGIGNGVQLAPVISGVQRMTPDVLQGRVMGAVEALGAIFPGLGLILGGVLVSVVSPRVAFAVIGSGACLTAIAFARVHLDRVPAVPAGAATPADALQ